jgi:hypothetical protein
MAQDSRSAKALNTSVVGGDVSNAYTTNAVTTLRAAIASTNTIRAADINNLITLINNWVGHYHTYDDYYQLATYGNTGDRANYIQDRNTTSTFGAAVASVEVNNLVEVATHNTMVSRVTQMSSHSHGIFDRDTL